MTQEIICLLKQTAAIDWLKNKSCFDAYIPILGTKHDMDGTSAKYDVCLVPVEMIDEEMNPPENSNDMFFTWYDKKSGYEYFNSAADGAERFINLLVQTFDLSFNSLTEECIDADGRIVLRKVGEGLLELSREYLERLAQITNRAVVVYADSDYYPPEQLEQSAREAYLDRYTSGDSRVFYDISIVDGCREGCKWSCSKLYGKRAYLPQ